MYPSFASCLNWQRPGTTVVTDTGSMNTQRQHGPGFSSELSDATSSDQPHDLAVESSPQPVASDPRPTPLALLKYLSDSELFALISTRLAHAEPFHRAALPLSLVHRRASRLPAPARLRRPWLPTAQSCQQRPASNAPNACPSAILASLAALCTFLTPDELRRLVHARLDASAAPHHVARWFLEFMQSGGDAVPLGKAALDARHVLQGRETRVRGTTRSPKRERVDVYTEPAPAPSVSSTAPPPHGAPVVRPGLCTPPPLITKESSSPTKENSSPAPTSSLSPRYIHREREHDLGVSPRPLSSVAGAFCIA